MLTNDQILDSTVVIYGYDSTIRKYLHRLLRTLWNETESFSGKSPFGNDGWEYELYSALVQLGVIEGEVDEDGYLGHVDIKHGDAVVFELIDHMCGVSV